MPDTLKPKQTKTPRNFESILKGALKLPLSQRVSLVTEVKVSIGKEVEDKKREASEAEKEANGL